MTEIAMVEVSQQHTAVVRARVPMAELTGFFGPAFEAVLRALRAQGAVPVGPPFGAYRARQGDSVEVEAGFPVATPVEDSDGVVASTLPGGRAVQGVHVGPYDTMDAAYAEVERWMAAQALEPGPMMWESYLTDPGQEPDPLRWRTLIVWPTA